MQMFKSIKVYEYQRLYVGTHGFEQRHLDALLRLNEYHDWKYFQSIAKGIQFNQYVGAVQIDDLLIEIHPKIDAERTVNKWQGVLLQMLEVCEVIKPTLAGIARVKRTTLNLIEIYFETYLLEIEKLARTGFIKRYRKKTSNTKALKGKLDFSRHIQKNLVHKERFYNAHQVYDTNHLLHQILYKALKIVGQFTKGTGLHDLYKRVELNFPKVYHKHITKNHLNSLSLGRNSVKYSYSLQLARLIILNYSPDISGGEEKMFSLLFDMNILWETYILKSLEKRCERNDIDVIGQPSKSFWGTKSLRPDIVLKRNGKTYILDTKWKCPKNGEVAVSDLRQMYTYCRFWNAEKALLLYPGETKGNDFQCFEIQDVLESQNKNTTMITHKCKIEFVSVVKGNGTINENLGIEILKILETSPV
ncbi:Restriction endonuclease [Tenacibaculum maritimum]|uniref:McrC family protein n=2 Tax=Tenacibaculum maritimum TaxID=107401 RepID=UPI0012E6C903|nr:restriction endonuclease [Tenacibaculum maritimum]CAA0154172.1 Restriction endonuclease [Tenacibaculum maritimum]CAA0207332.1 Restriction endonuclease [Tenacibaculum maritimum]